MLDVAVLRQQFPALQIHRNGRTPIFLDGPAGTQVPQRVVDAMSSYLIRSNPIMAARSRRAANRTRSSTTLIRRWPTS